MSGRAKFLWSVRRELWEHRAVYFAPLAVALLAVVAFFFHLGRFADGMRAVPAMEPAKQLFSVVIPYSISASVIILTSFLVAMFYCTDALYSERRDRSIQFWKSMPVSDLTSVASKAFIPLVVLPLIAYLIVVGTHLLMMALGSIALVFNGVELSTFWSRFPLQMPLTILYGLVVHTLWFAPFYGWLLLVSAWAKKAPSLWAVVPVLATLAMEKMTFGTSHFASLIQYRFTGAMNEAFAVDAWRVPITKVSQLDPVRFLSTPGLWAGLVVMVAFLAGAVWLRRRREPI